MVMVLVIGPRVEGFYATVYYVLQIFVGLEGIHEGEDGALVEYEELVLDGLDKIFGFVGGEFLYLGDQGGHVVAD